MPAIPKNTPARDITEKITLRITAKMRKRIRALCVDHELDEAEIVRYMLEAGMGLCEKRGIGKLMEQRRAALDALGRPGEKRGRWT